MDTDEDKIRIASKDEDGKIITIEVTAREVNSCGERYAIDKTCAPYHSAPRVSIWKRKVSIRGRTIRLSVLIALAMIAICVGAAFATFYAVLNWSTNVTVVANTSICFYNWSGASKANTFTYSCNIFPGITTEDDNMTYGVDDWNNTGATNAAISWVSCTNSNNITALTLTVYQSTPSSYVFQEVWSSVPSFPTPYQAFSGLANNTLYSMQIIITAASGAVVGTGVAMVFDMKVTSP
jgi:hypothetical protein